MASVSEKLKRPKPVKLVDTPDAPAAPANETVSSPDVAHLQEVLKESAERLDAADASSKPKRGRGRPRKDGTMGSERPGSARDIPKQDAAPIDPGPLVEPLKGGVVIGGEFLTEVTGYEGWRFEDPQAHAIGASLAPIVATIMPKADPLQTNIGLFLVTTLAIIGPKYLGYAKWKRDKKMRDVTPKPSPQPGETAAPPPPPPQQPAPADAFFERLGRAG